MPLTRRHLLRQTATLAAAASLPRRVLAQPATATARLSLDPSRTLATIPLNFLGLGYEISSLPRGIFSARGPYVDLVRTLGPNGVIRIGGNTADFAHFHPSGDPVSTPKATIVTQRNLDDLRAFLDATGWQLIWSVNLGSGAAPPNIAEAVAEAVAVSQTIGPHLLAIEIGNEPDLFFLEHRPKPYTYANFLAEYVPVRDALLHRLPHLPLAGPDVAGSTGWVRRFAADQPQNLKLLTHHYYREGQNPSSTVAKLLAPDPKLPGLLAELRSVSDATGIPYRICEVNSFSGGGRPGVSDTFASALWVLDYLLLLAQNGCGGVNLETGVNQLGFVSSYSPIFENPDGAPVARPEFLGMLAFAEATGTAPFPNLTYSSPVPPPTPVQLVPCTLSAGTAHITAYAMRRPVGGITVVLINKEPDLDLTVTPDLAGLVPASFPFALTTLTAPDLASTTGVRLSSRNPASLFQPPIEIAPLGELRNGQTAIRVPAASAMLLHLLA